MRAPRAITTPPSTFLPGADERDRDWDLGDDLRPAAVWVARTVEDVQGAVRFARAQEMRVSAMAADSRVCAALPPRDGTLLLLLALPAGGGVTVDAQERVATVWGGALWGDVVDAVTPYGLTATHASSRSSGVIGDLLGGGVSCYGRAHGRSVNSVRAVELVTPAGDVRWADRTHLPELLPRLRDGSAGVVTAVELELLPYSLVYGGALTFAAADAPRVLRRWRDWTQTAPSLVSSTFRMVSLPELPQVPGALRRRTVAVVEAVSLEVIDGARLETQLRQAATPIAGRLAPLPSRAAIGARSEPAAAVAGIRSPELTLGPLDDAAIDTFLALAGPGSPLLFAELKQLGAALALPPRGNEALGALDGDFLTLAGGIPGRPASEEVLRGALDRYGAALEPWARG